jgi:hypothetical protein
LYSTFCILKICDAKHILSKASLNPAWELEVFSALVDCPNCGTEVVTAVKSWLVSFGKQEECPKCETKFRSKVEFRAKSAETTNVKNAVEKIKGIREGLMQTLKTLWEK